MSQFFSYLNIICAQNTITDIAILFVQYFGSTSAAIRADGAPTPGDTHIYAQGADGAVHEYGGSGSPTYTKAAEPSFPPRTSVSTVLSQRLVAAVVSMW